MAFVGPNRSNLQNWRNGLIQFDNFNRYSNSAVLNNAAPLIGSPWVTTGANLPTVASGECRSSGTGYLYSTLPLTPATIAADIAFSGGSDLGAMGMTIAYAIGTPPLSLNELLHLNFGPLAFSVTIRQGGGSFVPIMNGTWAVPMSNDGAPHQIGMVTAVDRLAVFGPAGEQYSVRDPNIPSLIGKIIFWEPNRQADGLQAGVRRAYAYQSARASFAPTFFNRSDKSAAITLLTDGVTASCNSTTGDPQIRSVAGRMNGKVHVEFQIVNNANPAIDGIGLGVASFSEHAFSTYLGGDFKSVGLYPATSTSIFTAGAAYAVLGAGMRADNGDVLAMEVDFDAGTGGGGLIWYKNVTKATGWNNGSIGAQNPATGTGGLDLGAHSFGGGPFGICISIRNSGNSVKLNAGQEAFAQTPSAGFVSWL